MPGEEDKKQEEKKEEKKEEPKEDKKDEKVEDKKEDKKDEKPKEDAKKEGEPKPDDKAKIPDKAAGSPEEKKGDYVNFGGDENEDPYENDEETYKDHFRKTFITQDNKKESASLYTLHDMMIPAGRTAKLVRVPNPNAEDFRVTEPLDKLKFVEPTPVIILGGAMGSRAGKVLAGVARAAFRAGACIIDSGIGSGIEKFCMRKSVPLVGICPENEISYPVNSSNKKENELTNGHTHFILTGDDTKNKYRWGEESKLKAEVAKRIAKGRSKYGSSYEWKIILVVVGDNPECVEDIVQAKENNFPIIVLEGSQFSADIIAAKGGLMADEDDHEEKKHEGEGDAEENIGGKKPQENSAPEGQEIKDSALKDIVSSEKIYLCKQNSEHIANISHLLLTVTL